MEKCSLTDYCKEHKNNDFCQKINRYVTSGFFDTDGKIASLLEDAFFAGRKMADKLCEYKLSKFDKIVLDGVNQDERRRIRKLRIEIQESKIH